MFEHFSQYTQLKEDKVFHSLMSTRKLIQENKSYISINKYANLYQLATGYILYDGLLNRLDKVIVCYCNVYGKNLKIESESKK